MSLDDQLSCTLRACLSEPELFDRPPGPQNDTLRASARTPQPTNRRPADAESASSAASIAGDFCTPRGSTMTLTGGEEDAYAEDTTSFASPAASVLHLPSSPTAGSTYSFHSAAVTQSPHSFQSAASPSQSPPSASASRYASVSSLNDTGGALPAPVPVPVADPPDFEPHLLLYKEALEHLRAGHVVQCRTMRLSIEQSIVPNSTVYTLVKLHYLDLQVYCNICRTQYHLHHSPLTDVLERNECRTVGNLFCFVISL